MITVLTGAAVSAAPVTSDPLGCDETVHDPDGVLDLTELNPAILTTAATLDADLRIRAEGALDGGLDRRIDQLQEQCPGWSSGGELADDMVVILFSPVERENSVFYGANLWPVLERRWDAATDAMIPHLRAGDYTEAVAAGLRGLTRDPVGSSTVSEPAADENDGGASGAVVLALVVLAAVIAISVPSKRMGWSSGGSGWSGDSDDGRGWSRSSRRRRSFSSFGSRSRSSSRSSRSSRSRRAGGGTKKW